MSECGCILSYSDGETLMLKSKTPIARKKYVCLECQQKIHPGEMYHRSEYIFENGKPESYICCLNCYQIGKALFCNGYSMGYMWEEITEHIRYTNGEVSSEILLSLSLENRMQIIDMIDEYFDSCGNSKSKRK